MSRFRHFLAIDWSGARGQWHKGIALALSRADGGPPVLVQPGPRGWSRAEVLTLLREQGCERILCFPLYPQYAAATTASTAAMASTGPATQRPPRRSGST